MNQIIKDIIINIFWLFLGGRKGGKNATYFSSFEILNSNDKLCGCYKW